MAQEAPNPCSLLGLPRELRDKVYDETFKSHFPFELLMPTYGQPHPRSGTQPSSSRRNEAPAFHVYYGSLGFPVRLQRGPREMLWLLSNKQVCCEAIEQFQRKAIWMFTARAMDNSGAVGRRSNPSRGRHETRVGPALFLPTGARKVFVHNRLKVTERCELDHRGNPAWFIIVDGCDIVPDLFAQLTDSSNLQTISLNLLARDYPLEAPEGVPLHVKIGQLDRLVAPNLREVKFTVEYRENFLDRQDHVKALEDSLSETGIDLVGGEGVMTIHTAYTSPRIVVYTCTRMSS